MKTKIKHRCLIHDLYWDCTPNNILSGVGCPKCKQEKINKKKYKSHECYVKQLKKINSNIIVIEKYIDAKTLILHKCIKHNVEWKALPTNMLKGCGCPQCRIEKASLKNRKTHDEYICELNIIDPNIIVLGKYIGANTPILHKCLKDGYEWMARPSNILFGKGCPRCRSSKGEKRIKQYLDRHDIKYIAQKKFDDCIDQKPLPFDFYLTNLNICIEFQGEQHYKIIEYFGGRNSFLKRQQHDQIKREYCKKNNIQLLEIRYDADIQKELDNFLFI